MSLLNDIQLLVQPTFASVVTSDWFRLAHWQDKNAVLGKAQGRGNTWFFRYQEADFVLRHYLRGGMMGRYNKAQYLFLGANRTRSFVEFRLNQKLYDLGLPVAKPVAARFIRTGFWYRADFIGKKIIDSQTLLDYVRANQQDQEIWEQVKTTVERFHEAGLNHVDLNVRNILVTADRKIYLIDFDKCNLQATKKTKRQNFSRLSRSVLKTLGETKTFI